MSDSVVVECVPNFSVGKKEDVVEAISAAIRSTDGCSLLDVDSGYSTNRTVYTFVGTPAAVIKGALNAARVAHEKIDMTNHQGEHPRMGALDVCPFIPVANVTMEECVKCSQQFGEQLANMLNVPVYLYEYSSSRDYRKSLSQIREGEYEGLEKKLSQSQWAPDYGPSQFVPRWGATITGARKYLIAYNVNLLSTKEQAHRIALIIREKGKADKLPGVKAIGWYLSEHEVAQISINLTDFETTPLHVVYEKCVHHAQSLNLPVVGSEIVGLLPLKALLMVADYYIEKESLFILHESQKMKLAINRLGLSSINEFNPHEKIIEYRTNTMKDGPLLSSTVRQFVESVAARSPTPGGGSISACIASMGAALGVMVGMMTYGRKQWEHLDQKMRAAIKPLHEIMMEMLPLVDRDTQAYEDYMNALKLPKTTEDHKQRRQQALQNGVQGAIDVPLLLMKKADCCWPHFLVLAECGNIHALSDLQVGVRSLETGMFGAYCNVLTNLENLSDHGHAKEIRVLADKLLLNAQQSSGAILRSISNRTSTSSVTTTSSIAAPSSEGQ